MRYADPTLLEADEHIPAEEVAGEGLAVVELGPGRPGVTLSVLVVDLLQEVRGPSVLELDAAHHKLGKALEYPTEDHVAQAHPD